MARKSKTSPAEDIADLVALLPWWCGVSLAVSAYFGLHFLATNPAPVPLAHADAIAAVFVKAAAGFAQYLIPFLCLMGAAISLVRRRRSAKLLDMVAGGADRHILNAMSWHDFELMVGQWFRSQGFSVTDNHEAGPDGGVDLVLRKSGEQFLVQCKQWRAQKVGVSVVRELYGVMAARRATGGYVITSGRFSDEALAFASGRNVHLIDGQRLAEMIQALRLTGGAPAERVEHVPALPAAIIPSCPMCGNRMVNRTAKRGPNMGKRFWGCSSYPACKATVSAGAEP